MFRHVLSWIVLAAVAGLLGGCVPSSPGPSIPTTPRTYGSTPSFARHQEEATQSEKPAKRKFGRRTLVKAQSTPRTRSPELEDGPR
ncbi:MAG: hypothetical protein U0790_09210 [Isosphaeraceae bacterium]